MWKNVQWCTCISEKTNQAAHQGLSSALLFRSTLSRPWQIPCPLSDVHSFLDICNMYKIKINKKINIPITLTLYTYIIYINDIYIYIIYIWEYHVCYKMIHTYMCIYKYISMIYIYIYKNLSIYIYIIYTYQISIYIIYTHQIYILYISYRYIYILYTYIYIYHI